MPVLTQHDADQIDRITGHQASRPEHEASAGRVVRARLHADESVLPEQCVRVGHLTFHRQHGLAGGHQIGERRIGGDHFGEPKLVGRGRDGAGIEPARVGVDRVLHPQLVRRDVHLVHELGDRAGHLAREQHCDVVRRRQQ